MLTIDIGKKIHEQITPENWAKRSFFCTKDNLICSRTDLEMDRACLIGWVDLRYGEFERGKILRKIHEYLKEYWGTDYLNVIGFNDTSKFEEVHQVLKDLDV